MEFPMSRWCAVALSLAVSAGILAMHGLGPVAGPDAGMAAMQHVPAVELVAGSTLTSDHDMSSGDHIGELCVWVLITIAALAVLARRRARLQSSASQPRQPRTLGSCPSVASARAGPTSVLLC
jgi:hypothetical protein